MGAERKRTSLPSLMNGFKRNGEESVDETPAAGGINESNVAAYGAPGADIGVRILPRK